VWHDNLFIDLNYKLNNNHFSNAISHKDLNALLKKAKKEIEIDSSDNPESNENEEFNNLVITWTETSKRLLLMLNKQNQVLTRNRNPKSLMAFGAMGAHINMALQALKSTESD
tara:strand:+ start:835 stop:1173 length:339 start_codon:yes stop_codon:yes gene_type:complete